MSIPKAGSDFVRIVPSNTPAIRLKRPRGLFEEPTNPPSETSIDPTATSVEQIAPPLITISNQTSSSTKSRTPLKRSRFDIQPSPPPIDPTASTVEQVALPLFTESSEAEPKKIKASGTNNTKESGDLAEITPFYPTLEIPSDTDFRSPTEISSTPRSEEPSFRTATPKPISPFDSSAVVSSLFSPDPPTISANQKAIEPPPKPRKSLPGPAPGRPTNPKPKIKVAIPPYPSSTTKFPGLSKVLPPSRSHTPEGVLKIPSPVLKTKAHHTVTVGDSPKDDFQRILNEYLKPDRHGVFTINSRSGGPPRRYQFHYLATVPGKVILYPTSEKGKPENMFCLTGADLHKLRTAWKKEQDNWSSFAEYLIHHVDTSKR